MKVTLRVSTPFREALGEKSEVHGEGEKLKDFFEDIFLKFPALQEKLFNANGELKNHVKIYINGVDINGLLGLDSSLSDGDIVQVLAIADGG
jgi:molybdopterin converting factor small subunit